MKALLLSFASFLLLIATDSSAVISITYVSADPSCGHNNGFIHPTVSGGVAPFTYLWTSGQTTLGINNLGPGTYTLTVHDAVNTTATQSWTLVNQPTFFADAFSYIAPQSSGLTGVAHPCNSQCNGIIFMYTEFVGGTPPYSLSASPYHPTGTIGAAQVPVVQNICSTDNFTVTVTDVYGCTGTGFWLNNSYPPTSFNYTVQIYGACSGGVGSAAFNFTNLQGLFHNISWTGPESGYLTTGGPFPITLDSLTPGNYIMTVQNLYTWNTCDTVINFTIPNNVSGTPPSTPGSITTVGGSAKVCPGETKNYSIAAVSGATSYTWIPPVGAQITSGQGTVSVSVTYSASFTATDTLRVTANNACGASAQRKLKIARNNPTVPGSITALGGNTKVCPGDSKTYSILPVTGATSYTWTKPAGSSLTSGQGTISVNILYNSGFVANSTLMVKANNACGSSANRSLTISRNNPGTPSAITGQNYGVCNKTGVPYSVTNVAGMTYNWSFNGAPATIVTGQGTSSITVNFNPGYVSAILSVTATNGCGTSAVRNYTLYAKPPTPPSITGTNSVCQNQQNVPYAIAPIPNISNYTWAGPSGSHVSDGVSTSGGTTLITTAPAVTVNFGTTAGSVKVRANNSCASGSYRTLSVAVICRESAAATKQFDVTITPNPNTGSFTLVLTEPGSAYVHAVISNSIGQKMHEVDIPDNAAADLNFKLEPGIYFVEVSNAENRVARKMIVH